MCHHIKQLETTSISFTSAFESQLTSKEKSSLVRQLAMCFSTNKLSKDPFHMILSGVNETGRLRELLEKGLLHPEDNLTIPGRPANVLLADFSLNSSRIIYGSQIISFCSTNR